MFDIYADSIKTNDLLKESMDSFKSSMQKFEPNAFYMALVVNTNDDMKLGRIQVRIPAIHGVNNSQSYYLKDEALPWARPAIFSGAGNDMGQFIIPPKGTIVYVTFEYNSMDKPIYFGGIPMLCSKNTKSYNDNASIYGGQPLIVDTNDRIKDLKDDSSQYVLFKSLKGATIIVDDKDGIENIKIIDAAGQQIIMQNDSDYALDRRGNNTTSPSTSSIRIITNGKVSVECDEFNLKTNKTNLSDYIQ